jgi:hypothetical protein
MAERPKPAPEVMSPDASLHPDQAARMLAKRASIWPRNYRYRWHNDAGRSSQTT